MVVKLLSLFGFYPLFGLSAIVWNYDSGTGARARGLARDRPTRYPAKAPRPPTRRGRGSHRVVVFRSLISVVVEIVASSPYVADRCMTRAEYLYSAVLQTTHTYRDNLQVAARLILELEESTIVDERARG